MCWFCAVLVFWTKGFNVGCLLVALIPTFGCCGGFDCLRVWACFKCCRFWYRCDLCIVRCFGVAACAFVLVLIDCFDFGLALGLLVL